MKPILQSVSLMSLVLLGSLTLAGCTGVEAPKTPTTEPVFQVGDAVTTKNFDPQVTGIILNVMYDQYWADDQWSCKVKYVNQIGNINHEWFPESQLEKQ